MSTPKRTIAPETRVLMDLLKARTSLRIEPLLKEMGEAIAVVDGLVAEATRIENAVRAIRYSDEHPELKGELRAWENLGAALMSQSRELRKVVDGIVDKVSNMDRIEADHELIIEAFLASDTADDPRQVFTAARHAAIP